MALSIAATWGFLLLSCICKGLGGLWGLATAWAYQINSKCGGRTGHV